MSASSNIDRNSDSFSIFGDYHQTSGDKPLSDEERRTLVKLNEITDLVSVILFLEPGTLPIITAKEERIDSSNPTAPRSSYKVTHEQMWKGWKKYNNRNLNATVDFIVKKIRKNIEDLKELARENPETAKTMKAQKFQQFILAALLGVETVRVSLGADHVSLTLSRKEGKDRLQKYTDLIGEISGFVQELTPSRVKHYVSSSSSGRSTMLVASKVAEKFLGVLSSTDVNEGEVKRVFEEMDIVLASPGIKNFDELFQEKGMVDTILSKAEADLKQEKNISYNFRILLVFLKNFSVSDLAKHRAKLVSIQNLLRDMLMPISGQKRKVADFSEKARPIVRELIATEEVFNEHMGDFAPIGNVSEAITALVEMKAITQADAELLVEGREGLKKASELFLRMLDGGTPYEPDMLDNYLNILGELALKTGMIAQIIQKYKAVGGAEECIRKFMIPQHFETRLNEPFQRVMRLKLLLAEVERANHGDKGVEALTRYLKYKVELINAMNTGSTNRGDLNIRAQLLRNPNELSTGSSSI